MIITEIGKIVSICAVMLLLFVKLPNTVVADAVNIDAESALNNHAALKTETIMAEGGAIVGFRVEVINTSLDKRDITESCG